MLTSKSDSFDSYFLIRMLFISFSCLIALTRTSNTMFNKSGKVSLSCPYLRGNAFGFLPLTMKWPCHIQPLLYWCRFPVYSLSWEFVIINWCWILSKAFYTSIEIILWLILPFVNVVYHVGWFIVFEKYLKSLK